MKHTTDAEAAPSPAQHAAPNPRRGTSMTCAPSDRASLPDPSVDPLSATIGWYPEGILVEDPLDGLGLVEHRQDHVGHGARLSTAGRSGRR